jgi:hypothetical protein
MITLHNGRTVTLREFAEFCGADDLSVIGAMKKAGIRRASDHWRFETGLDGPMVLAEIIKHRRPETAR